MGNVVADRSVSHEFLSSRTDDSRSDSAVLKVFTEGLLRFGHFEPPHTASVPDFNLPVFNPEIHRLIRLSFHDDGIVSGSFQFGAPESSGLAFPIPSAEGRFSPYAVPPAPRKRMAGNWTEGKNKLVLRPQRVHSPGDFLQQSMDDEPTTPQVGFVESLIRRLR